MFLQLNVLLITYSLTYLFNISTITAFLELYRR